MTDNQALVVVMITKAYLSSHAGVGFKSANPEHLTSLSDHTQGLWIRLPPLHDVGAWQTLHVCVRGLIGADLWTRIVGNGAPQQWADYTEWLPEVLALPHAVEAWGNKRATRSIDVDELLDLRVTQMMCVLGPGSITAQGLSLSDGEYAVSMPYGGVATVPPGLYRDQLVAQAKRYPDPSGDPTGRVIEIVTKFGLENREPVYGEWDQVWVGAFFMLRSWVFAAIRIADKWLCDHVPGYREARQATLAPRMARPKRKKRQADTRTNPYAQVSPAETAKDHKVNPLPAASVSDVIHDPGGDPLFQDASDLAQMLIDPVKKLTLSEDDAWLIGDRPAIVADMDAGASKGDPFRVVLGIVEGKGKCEGKHKGDVIATFPTIKKAQNYCAKHEQSESLEIEMAPEARAQWADELRPPQSMWMDAAIVFHGPGQPRVAGTHQPQDDRECPAGTRVVFKVVEQNVALTADHERGDRHNCDIPTGSRLVLYANDEDAELRIHLPGQQNPARKYVISPGEFVRLSGPATFEVFECSCGHHECELNHRMASFSLDQTINQGQILHLWGFVHAAIMGSRTEGGEVTANTMRSGMYTAYRARFPLGAYRLRLVNIVDKVALGMVHTEERFVLVGNVKLRTHARGRVSINQSHSYRQIAKCRRCAKQIPVPDADKIRKEAQALPEQIRDQLLSIDDPFVRAKRVELALHKCGKPLAGWCDGCEALPNDDYLKDYNGQADRCIGVWVPTDSKLVIPHKCAR